MACGWGVAYYVLHLHCVFIVKLWDDVIKLCCILCHVRQSKLTLQLREPHGWFLRPERRDTSTDAVDIESRIRRLLRPCWWVSVLLHDAFVGLPMWWYRYELPDSHNAHAHAQLYVHATLLLCIRAMSAAGRLLAAAPKSCHTLTALFSFHLHMQFCLSIYKDVVYGQ